MQQRYLHPNSISKCNDKKVKDPVATTIAKTGTVAIIPAKYSPSPESTLKTTLGIKSNLHLPHFLKNLPILKLSPDFCIVLGKGRRRRYSFPIIKYEKKAPLDTSFSLPEKFTIS